MRSAHCRSVLGKPKDSIVVCSCAARSKARPTQGLLLSSALEADDASWVAGRPPSAIGLSAKTRYRQSDAACTFDGEGATAFGLRFAQSQWAATPGQSAVLYDGEVCLGGGVILSAIASAA